MKLLSLLVTSAIRADEETRFETQEVQTQMTVHENQHTMCDQAQLSDEYECHTVDNFTRCSASCGVGSMKKKRCECYRTWMMLAIYDVNECKWTDFDDTCSKIVGDVESHLYPHGVPTTTNTKPTTTITTTVTTSNPKFGLTNVKHFSSGTFKQIKHHSSSSSTVHKPLNKPLSSHLPTKNHFSLFLQSLHRFAKATLVGIDRGEMQKMVYKKLR